jgi:hypothetical protein
VAGHRPAHDAEADKADVIRHQLPSSAVLSSKADYNGL